jgi:hypothetical protein
MNILHGDSAGGSFKQAFKLPQEQMLVFHDVLSCGPLEKYIGIDTWRKFREEYWDNLDKTSAIENFSYNVLERDFYWNFDRLEQTDEYRLWIGTGLSDQLLLAFIVSLMAYHAFDISKLSVYQFERIEEKNFEVQGLGLLKPDQIKRHPIPIKLNDKQIEEAKLAWDAVTENTPDKYLHYMRSKNDTLPLMKRALTYLLYRYPKAHNGLSYWDETLLRYSAEHGPNTAKILGYSMTDRMSGLDLVGDFYLFNRLKEMGRPELRRPLITANALNLPLRETQVAIMSDGVRALQGKINVIEENGIDDWVCGVHLNSLNKNVWARNSNEGIFHLSD